MSHVLGSEFTLKLEPRRKFTDVPGEVQEQSKVGWQGLFPLEAGEAKAFSTCCSLGRGEQ